MAAPAPLPTTSDLYDPAPPIATRTASSHHTHTHSHDSHTDNDAHTDLDTDVEKQSAQDVHEAKDVRPTLDRSDSEFKYPSMKKALVIMIGLYCAIFIVALDRTILGVAIPKITDEFNSFSDIGWYQSAYMLTTAGFQLFFGRIYTFYSPKWTFIASIALFEIGSAVSGAAPSSNALIVGRAISGVGGAGMFSGSMVIILNVLPLPKRPLFMGLIGGIFGIASVVGPLLGGVFTSDVSWRWCFYINLPIGGVCIAILLVVLRQDFTMAAAGKSTREKILQLDPLGTLCFLPALICLLLALEWGGSTYAWSNGRIIALLVLFCVLLIAFGLLQVFRSEDRVTVPVRIMKQRSILAGMWFTLFGGGTMVVFTLYIPIWFQAIQGTDAVEAGIRTIPLLLGMVIFIIFSGAMVQRTGYYTPFMIIGAIIFPIGAGMITTWGVASGANQWIGYQVLIGIGFGFSLQQPNIAAQTVLSRKDSAMGVSLMILCQTLGGAIFASAAQNVLDNSLIKNLTRNPVPGIAPATIVSAGATDLRSIVPSQYLQQFLVSYNDAISDAFKLGLGISCACILGAASMEWVSLKKKNAAGAAAAAATPKDAPEAAPASLEPDNDDEQVAHEMTDMPTHSKTNMLTESKETF